MNRRQQIADLIAREPVASQSDLARLLRARGTRVTQATLSRDLRSLGVLKGPAGYTLPGAPVRHDSTPPVLAAALRSLLAGADSAGNLAVLSTGPGQAAVLALAIDQARLAPVVGTVAGDDTVFVATRTPRAAGRLLADFKRLAGVK